MYVFIKYIYTSYILKFYFFYNSISPPLKKEFFKPQKKKYNKTMAIYKKT